MTQQDDTTATLSIPGIESIWKRAGYSRAKFAEDYGSHKSAVTQFFQGKSVSAPMIAAARTMARYFLHREQGKRS